MSRNKDHSTHFQPQKTDIHPSPFYEQEQGKDNMPSQIPMMPAPPRPIGCPAGLQYLCQIDQLLVHQNKEVAEVLVGCANTKFTVKNSLGQQVFHVTEENDCCNRECCGSSRSFVLHVQDNLGQEVMTINRPMNFFFQELEVQSPPGNAIGFLIQDWHLYLPKFTVQNERREDILKIVGPFCTTRCCADVNFDVLSLDESLKVGSIQKQWSGFVNETFTDADNFGIVFPLDLDVKIKAALFGACFLINFMFFENGI